MFKDFVFKEDYTEVRLKNHAEMLIVSIFSRKV